MAHENILRNYTWITSQGFRFARVDKLDLIDEVLQAESPNVLSMVDRISVYCSESALGIIEGQHFDAFAIIKSPDYTNRQKIVYKTVESIIGKRFPKSLVRRNKCRADYRYSQRYLLKKKLFESTVMNSLLRV